MGVTSLGAAGKVEEFDEDAGLIVLSRNPDLPHPTALVPLANFPPESQRRAIVEIGAWVAANGLRADGPYAAARDLLTRRPPRLKGSQRISTEPLARPAETGKEAALRLVPDLDRTTLAIQGPPGSGKSTAGAKMILELIGQGKRVGITATSHKVIYNLEQKVEELAASRGETARMLHRIKADQCPQTDSIKAPQQGEATRDALDADEVKHRGRNGMAVVERGDAPLR